jgi:hypothetical protein
VSADVDAFGGAAIGDGATASPARLWLAMLAMACIAARVTAAALDFSG